MPSAMPIDASGSVRESGAVAIRPAIEADLPTIVGIYAHPVSYTHLTLPTILLV